MAESVTVSRVGKRFGVGEAALPVLQGVGLEIAAGEFVAVLGPSGCGKSTLLRLIAGLDRPSTGTVRLGDREVTGVNPRCAVVFQEPRLLPWKTVAANVALGGRRLLNAPSPEELLELVGLTGFGGSRPHQLSGGMAQRAALARALIGRPGVLLLDEPFAALDALNRMRMQDLVAGVCRELRPTVVLVTHDVDEAIFLADRVVILDQRPATVTATVPIPLSRPRDRSDPALAALRAEVLSHVGFSSPAAAADVAVVA